MENVIAVGVIIGIGNAVKTQFPQVSGLYGVILSVVLGLIAGYFNILEVASLEAGLLIGLAASGTYTVVKRVGGNS